MAFSSPLNRRALMGVLLGTAASALPWGAAVHAADQATAWPQRPIKLIVPYPPGGNSDNLGRIVAERLSSVLGASIVVDNKPGGTTQIGTELAARSAPDGYTLLLGAGTAFTVLPNLRSKLPYDPVADFVPLGGIADYVAVLAVRKDLGVNSAQDLVALAKKHPGKLTFGSAGLASFGQIGVETLKNDLGIDLLHVPYKGSADAATALAAGQIDVLIDGAVVPLAKAGRVKPLAAFGNLRHPELPGLPTLKQAGVDVAVQKSPGWGLFAPKGTPSAITAQLSQALNQVLAEPATQERMAKVGTLSSWQPPQALMDAFAHDRSRYAQLLPAIGLIRE